MNTIIEIKLDEYHPLWPNQTLYAIKNLMTGKTRFGRYTTRDRAEYWLDRVNKQEK